MSYQRDFDIGQGDSTVEGRTWSTVLQFRGVSHANLVAFIHLNVFCFSASMRRWLVSHKAPNAEAGDGFGSSVALSGDTLAVGAPEEDSSATGGEADNSTKHSGAVYAFP
jgi:hypothetical protein